MNDLLFLAHRVPYPPNKGDKLRSFHLLRFLSRHYRVHLGCFVDDPDDFAHVDRVKEYCDQTCLVRLDPMVRRAFSLTALLRGEALSLAYYRNAELSAWVRSIRARYDIRRTLVFSSVMAQFAPPVEGERRVADFVDVDSAKWSRYARECSWPMSWLYGREARTLLDFERSVANDFNASVFVSSAEASLFVELSGVDAARVHSADNGVDTEYFRPGLGSASPYGANARVIVFTGAMDYWPNVDAVRWFVEEVFPRLRQQWNDLVFAIVGARPTSEVKRLGERSGVIVTGTVPDVRPYLEHAVAAVAPLRIARGIQNKVLEGMAMARPVVATPDAAEGLAVDAGVEILVARDADEFVSSLARVLNGGAQIGIAARERVLRSYAWDANLAGVRDLLEGTIKGEESACVECAAAA